MFCRSKKEFNLHSMRRHFILLFWRFLAILPMQRQFEPPILLADLFSQNSKSQQEEDFRQKRPIFFGFCGPKIGGGSCNPSFVQKYQKPRNLAYFGVFLPALGWSCRTVLHTSVPACRGLLTEIFLLLGFSGPRTRDGGVLPNRAFTQAIKNPRVWPILEYFCPLSGGAAHQCTCIV